MDFLLLCTHLHWCHTISILCFPDRILMNMCFPAYSGVNLQLRNKSLPPIERELPYNKGNSFKNFFAVLCWPKPIRYVFLRKVLMLVTSNHERISNLRTIDSIHYRW